MRTGRPVVKRSSKALNRDISTFKRLRRSILADSSLDEKKSATLIKLLDAAIAELDGLLTSVCVP